MRLLLDTHVLLWALAEPERLSPLATAALVSPQNAVLVSAVSAWEIAIKQSLNKIELPGPAETWLPAAIEQTGFGWLDIRPTDALRVRGLPWHHRDPFDRMLVAQAGDDFTLVTHDKSFDAYAVTVLPA
ncbi:hypothetical protein ABI59_14790 [Acidobacteria bacterium Mor1]|nr:hypothetical protein ABI59_14790 [Acidobacteria bacterium Mor1]